MQRIRTIIVDDEVVARKGVRNLLADDSDIEIIGEFGNGVDAAIAIQRDHPDLALLDVQMPDLDGFGCLNRVPVQDHPVVVFMTAFEQHAIRAFEVRAIDYILKPFSDERFASAIESAKERVKQRRLGNAGTELLSLLESARQTTARTEYMDRIMVRDTGSFRFVMATDIQWIEAADYYARVHTVERSHLVRESLQDLETRLDPHVFLRVHRSAIVNLNAIVEIQPLFNGSYMLILGGGAKVQLSRRRRSALETALGHTL